MITIMVIDDTQDILMALELLIEEYMEDNDIDDTKYSIILQNDPKEALEIIKDKQPDIVFLDIMMPNLSGFDILKTIRENKLIKQPIVIMSTALADEGTKSKEQELKANAYMVKPFNYSVVKIMLDRYFTLKDNDDISDDDIFDFDFDDFDNIDDDEIEHDIEEMDHFNASHKKIPASEFLSQFDESEIDLEEIEEIENDFNKLIYKLEDTEDLEEFKEEIVLIFNKYKSFLNIFSEFEEIYNVIVNLIVLLESVNLDQVKKKKYLSGFLIALISDLMEWQRHVFLDEDAQDIFYMNASILNSYIQLKDIIDKELNNK